MIKFIHLIMLLSLKTVFIRTTRLDFIMLVNTFSIFYIKSLASIVILEVESSSSTSKQNFVSFLFQDERR